MMRQLKNAAAGMIAAFIIMCVASIALTVIGGGILFLRWAYEYGGNVGFVVSGLVIGLLCGAFFGVTFEWNGD